MKKEEAARILGVPVRDIEEFELIDTFNPDNTVCGFVSRSQSSYGSMVIYKVNHYFVEQVVIGTPKQKYPFDKLGKWLFPVSRQVRVYEKLDGTNVLAYKYKGGGKTYLSYKARLSPFLRNGRWGDFFEMWKEMLEKYPIIKQLVERYVLDSGINLSFELYGARNKHLIDYYPVLLDTALLFGIKNSVEEPAILDPKEIDSGDIPLPNLVVEIGSKKDLTSWYQKLRKQQEALNKTTEDGIVGSEGFVWYLTDTKGGVRQYKCKPETIEKIHWASGGISKGSIVTTVMNAYESTDDVTFDYVVQLLKEEFDERTIMGYDDLIRACMEKVEGDLTFRDIVLERYRGLGLDLNENKREVMRELTGYFSKREMRRVYSVLRIFLDRGSK